MTWARMLAYITGTLDQELLAMEENGFLADRRFLLHDRDSKYCSSFRQVIHAGGVKTLALPPRSPNLNAHAERWVRSVKEECLRSLSYAGGFTAASATSL